MSLTGGQTHLISSRQFWAKASTPLQPGEVNLELNLGTWALNALYALYALYAKYANVLVEKRTLVVKSKI